MVDRHTASPVIVIAATMSVVPRKFGPPESPVHTPPSPVAHVRFLEKYYASGHFLVSGRKIPRDGGVILAVGEDRDEIEAIIVATVTPDMLFPATACLHFPRPGAT